MSTGFHAWRPRRLRRLAKFMPLLAGLAILAWFTGCETGGDRGTGPKYVFFPPPPAAPRVQYLTSFSGGKDPEALTGKFAEFIVGKETTELSMLKPYGLAGAGNRLLICDTGTRSVDVLDLEAGTLSLFSPTGLGKIGVPINVAVDASGAWFVTDTGRGQVLSYDAAGDFTGMLDDTNTLRPTGVALTAERIYVSDLNSHCVRVYAKDMRRLLFTIPKDPKAEEEREPGKLYMPVNLALDAQGCLYVSDLAVCKVKVYDADGKFQRSFGSQGDLPGQFARPKGITVDRAGRVLVIDAASQTCQIFDGEGRFLLTFGEPDRATRGQGSLNLPAGVCVIYDQLDRFKKHAAPGFVLEELILISNQLGMQKVSVFGLGHKE